MYWFTGDEHLFHANIIKHSNRPFPLVFDMNNAILERHNEVVGNNDVVIHAGDTFWKKSYQEAQKYIEQLKGKHIFLKGSHDKWLKETNHHEIWEGMIEDQYIVVCHYAMRVWPRSHYGSWQLYGHSHCKLQAIGKQMDIGVDCHDYYPISFEQVKNHMSCKIIN